jgi:hypothetical protein
MKEFGWQVPPQAQPAKLHLVDLLFINFIKQKIWQIYIIFGMDQILDYLIIQAIQYANKLLSFLLVLLAVQNIDSVRTWTRHRVPLAMSVIRRTRRQRSLVGSAIRKTRRRGLLRPKIPHTQEGPYQGVRRLWAALAGLTALGLFHRRSNEHRQQRRMRRNSRMENMIKDNSKCVW